MRKEFANDTKRPWYYGHAYNDFYKGVYVAYIIPFHLPVRWWYIIANKWYRTMGKNSMIDNMMREAINQIERKWEAEFDERVRRALHQFKRQQSREIKRLLNECKTSQGK